LLPGRDANAAEAGVGVIFKPTAVISGEAHVNWLEYVPLDRTVDPFRGPTWKGALSRVFGARTSIGGLSERVMATSFAPQFPFAIVDRTGGWIQQVISRRFDVVGEIYRERFHNREFTRALPTLPILWTDADTRRYSAQFGVRVGRTRVAGNAGVVQRVQPASFRSVLVWLDVSYGIFQVRNR
jgi:hypothetical protein